MKLDDPYVVLGVARDSGPAEWKRAFRRLAMRWHPDRNDHPEATERFKVINAAYELIATVDAEQKQKSGMPEEAPAAEAEDSVARAADIRLNLEVSLEEAAAGCRKTMSVTRSKACATCEGSGEAGLTRTRFCDACHGSGRVHDAHRRLIKCDACDGRGVFRERVCPDCGGNGRNLAEVSLNVVVPPGMLPGDELRLVGQGNPGNDDLKAGNLYLTLIIQSHPLYQLQGRNLHYRMPVSALAMIAGASIELPLLGGLFSHSLEAGVPEPRTLRLTGKGYPGRGRSQAGDLVVELEPVFPRTLDVRQRKLLLQANSALMDNVVEALPEIADWRATYGVN